MTRTIKTSAAIVAAVLLFSGCASTEISRVRADIDRQMPDAQINEGRSFSFGMMSFGFARLVTRIAGVTDPSARSALRNVRKVKVGRYSVSGELDARQVAMPAPLRRYVDRGGWTTLATVRDENEAVWVLYRARGSRITDLFVTVLSDDELVLTRVSGNLSGIVLDVLEQQNVSLPFLGEAPAAVTVTAGTEQ